MGTVIFGNFPTGYRESLTTDLVKHPGCTGLV